MNNTLIITGASRGIGKATAQLFIDKDWTVINLSRHACDIPGVCNIAVDLLEAAFDTKVMQELARIFAGKKQICLVHNAASFIKDSAVAIDPQQLRQQLEINVVAPARLNKIIRPLMDKGSAIIYIGSTLSEKAVPDTASYITAKHALAGLMKATCQDLKDPHIHTCCVCPGFTDTDMLNAHIHHDKEIKQSIAAMVYANRLIGPGEIAELIYYAARNPVINGSILHANLGFIEH